MKTYYYLFWSLGGIAWLGVTLTIAARSGLSVVRTIVSFVLWATSFYVGVKLHGCMAADECASSFSLASLSGAAHRLPGGIVLAAVCTPLIGWVVRMPYLVLADLGSVATGIAIAIGRIGCHLNGCCFGSITELPWGIRYPRDTGPWMNHLSRGLLSSSTESSLDIHPLGLYFAIAALVVGAVTVYVYSRKVVAGEVTLAFLGLFGLSSAAIELMRERALEAHVPFRIEAWIIVGIAAVVGWAYVTIRGIVDPQDCT